MRPKSMILILIALGCGLVASIGINQVMQGRQVGSVETRQIYVAIADVPLGEPLTGQHVQLEEWPKDKIPEGAVASLEQVEGKRPNVPLYAGEPILRAKLIDSHERGGASDRIPKGYRVASVKVTMESGASGLILPGDRVDVLLFLKRTSEVRETGTRTLLRDVRVFAVNEKIDRETDKDGSVVNAKTVSLLVKPDQVEKLMLANVVGRLSLALRRADEDDSDGAAAQGAQLADLENGDVGSGEEGSGSPDNSYNDANPAPAGDAGGGFLGFLGSLPTPDPNTADTNTALAVNTVPVRTMNIHTPEGVMVYTWTDPTKLPVELAGSEAELGLTGLASGAPAQPDPTAASTTPPVTETPAAGSAPGTVDGAGSSDPAADEGPSFGSPSGTGATDTPTGDAPDAGVNVGSGEEGTEEGVTPTPQSEPIDPPGEPTTDEQPSTPKNDTPKDDVDPKDDDDFGLGGDPFSTED